MLDVKKLLVKTLQLLTALQSRYNVKNLAASKSVTLSANAQSSVTLTYSLPSGATIMSVSLSQVPNPNWVYAAINSYSNTQTVIAYRNTYTGSISGIFEVMILYRV